jgi:hypothetical protein
VPENFEGSELPKDTNKSTISNRIRDFIGRFNKKAEPQVNRPQEEVNSERVPLTIGPVEYQDRYEESVLENVRQMAKELAEVEGTILEFYCNMYDTYSSRITFRSFEKSSVGYGIGMGGGWGAPSGSGIEQFTLGGVFNNRDSSGDVRLSRSRDIYDESKLTISEPAKLLGITEGASDFLTIGVHMDRKTEEAVIEMAGQGENERAGGETIFVFTQDGKFGKLVALPKALQDDRQVVLDNYEVRRPFEIKGAKRKLVVADITPEDLEMVEYSMAVLTSVCEHAANRLPEEIESRRRGDP